MWSGKTSNIPNSTAQKPMEDIQNTTSTKYESSNEHKEPSSVHVSRLHTGDGVWDLPEFSHSISSLKIKNFSPPTHDAQDSSKKNSEKDDGEYDDVDIQHKPRPGFRIDNPSSAHSTTPFNQLQSVRQSTFEPFVEWKPSRAQWLMIISFMIVSLVVSLDATILVPILPILARDLHGSANDAFWTGTSYLLTCATFQPFIVSISDVFGRREALTGCVILFTIGTLICALAQNFTVLLVGRSIAGIGGGGITNLPNVIFTDFVPLRQRPTYTAFNQMAWAVGSVSGPLIGGLFADHTTWRWVFYINFPFCAVGLLLIPLVVRLKAERPPMKERFKCIDWIGAMLFIASIISLLFGVTSGGTQYSWKSARVIVTIVIGGIGLIVTLIWEIYGTSHPFLRLSVFSQYSAQAAYAAALLQGMLLFCCLYYIPLFLEAVRSFSATEAGLGMIPITAALVPVSVIVGAAITRSGSYRWAVWAGWIIVIIATSLLVLLNASLAIAAGIVIFIFLGIGHGLVLMSVNFTIQALAPAKDVGYAAAMYSFSRTFGMCIGVAIGGTIFQNRLKVYLTNEELPQAIATDAAAFVEALRQLPKDSAQRIAYSWAYNQSFRNLVEVLIAIAALGGVLSLFIKHVSMDKPVDSEHITQLSKSEARKSMA